MNRYQEAFQNNPISKQESRTEYFKRLAEDLNVSHKTLSTEFYKSRKNRTNQSEAEIEAKRYDFDRRVRVLNSQLQEQKKLYQRALSDLDESEKRFEALLSIKDIPNELNLKPTDNPEVHGAIPILVFSDWHIEEKVDGNTINNLNEYNPEIAQERINKLFNRSRKLIKHLDKFVSIDTIYVLLNGDMITGYIHDELRETNYLSPTQAIRLAKQHIIGGLEYLKKELKLKKIIVQCNYGNHGRSTEKRRHSGTAYKNSYEWLMYQDIADHFLNDKAFEFHVSNSLISYYIFRNGKKNFTLRTWHGDNLKFQGGVGGLTIPLNKLIYRLDQNKPADYNIIGHFHTLFEANKKALVNGSLIGYNGYAHDLGLEYEAPKQAMLLLDTERMEIRAKYTINCD